MCSVCSSKAKILLLAVIFSFAFVFLAEGALGFSGSGSGTQSDPYVITDWNELDEVRDGLDAYYELENDLDENSAGYNDHASTTANNGKGWDPIGDDNNLFKGTFDGQGHTIGGLYINRSTDHIGLFGIVKDGTVKNIGIMDATVRGDMQIGGLIGRNEDGAVKGSFARGNVEGNSRVGGLVGLNIESASINDSYATATVSGTDYIGGLVGRNVANIYRSYSTGLVDGDDDIGGLVGGGDDGIVEVSYWNTETSDIDESKGGEGRTTEDMAWEYGMNTYENWDMSEDSSEIWLSGDHEFVEDQQGNKGYPALEWQVNIVVKTKEAVDITHDSATIQAELVDLKGYNYAYVWFQWREDDGPWKETPVNTLTEPGPFEETLSKLENDTTYEFGVVAQAEEEEEEGDIHNFSTPFSLRIYDWNDLNNIRENLEGKYFLENNLNETTDGYNNHASENANGGKGWEPVGDTENPFGGSFDGQGYTLSGLHINRSRSDAVGFFGAIEGSVEGVGLSDTKIKGGDLTGGMVGGNNGTVSNTYITGSVEGTEYVGGLIGGNGGTVSNSYSTANVTGEQNRGGLIGQNYGDVYNSYWNTETSGQTSSSGGQGRTTDDMVWEYGVDTYEDWDFDNTWFDGDHELIKDQDGNHGYPALQWKEWKDYEVTIDIVGEGSTVPENGTHVYEYGEEVTIEVSADHGWHFSQWTGDYPDGEEKNREITITVESEKSLTAYFERGEYVLNVTEEGEGSVDIDPEEDRYKFGDEVNLTAVPADGWYFLEWAGDIEGENETVTVTMDQDKNITARFKEGEYALSITKEGQGSVDIDPEESKYESGVEVDLSASPDSGWYFLEWTGDYEGTDTDITVTMDENKNITAIFEEGRSSNGPSPRPSDPEEYELVVEYSQERGEVLVYKDGVLIEPDETDENGITKDSYVVNEDTELELDISSEADYRFYSWAGDVETDDLPLTITMDGDKSIEAEFVGSIEYILVMEQPVGDGSVTPGVGSHTFEEGEEIVLEADPRNRWEFERWGGDITSNKTTTNVTIDDDITVTAYFAEIPLEKIDAEKLISRADEMIDEGDPGHGTLMDAKRKFDEGNYDESRNLASAAMTEFKTDAAGFGIIPYVVISAFVLALTSFFVYHFRAKIKRKIPFLWKGNGDGGSSRLTIDKILQDPDKFLLREVSLNVQSRSLDKKENGWEYYKLADGTNEILGISKEGFVGSGEVEGIVRKTGERPYIQF